MATTQGYGKIVTSGSIFAYDVGDTRNSYIGEPTTNYIHHQNAVAQDSYSTYTYTTSGTWQAKHSKAIRAYNASGNEITGYVNGGVSDPTNKYHAHWQYDTVLKKPVVVMEDVDASWKAKSYGTGIPSWESLGKVVGDTYTISWLQWTDNLSKSARVGLYTRNPSNSSNFWDGLLAGSTAKNTKLKTWQRVYQTYTTSPSRNLSDTYASIYMYGHYDARATIKIADVQFDWGSHPKQFSPAYERTAAQGLLDLTGNSSIDLANVSFDSNAQMTFDGTNDSIILPDGTKWFTSEWAYEMVVKFNGSNGTYQGLLWGEGATGGGSGYQKLLTLYNYSYFHYRIQNSITGWTYTNFTPSGFTPGNYNHLVWQFTNGTTSLFINGNLVHTDTSRGTYNGGTNSSLYISGRNDGSYVFNGTLPVLKRYSRTLTPQEVNQNYRHYKTRFNLS